MTSFDRYLTQEFFLAGRDLNFLSLQYVMPRFLFDGYLMEIGFLREAGHKQASQVEHDIVTQEPFTRDLPSSHKKFAWLALEGHKKLKLPMLNNQNPPETKTNVRRT
jgi:hypothetical protein